MEGDAARPGGHRRIRYAAGVLLGVALLVAGLVLAVDGFTAGRGPSSTVRDYFSALARSDAATALAYGEVPDGPHTLLTDEVLRAQNRIAPLRLLDVGPARQRGSRAAVPVTYRLGFPGHPHTVTTRIALHEQGGDWYLDEVAVRTQLVVDGASQRAMILGGSVPDSTVLLFPGAVPISFDTPYLSNTATDYVGFGAEHSTKVTVQLTATGRRAVLAAVGAKLRSCLAGGDDTCPLPSERYVPGSIRGTLRDPSLPGLNVSVGADPSGRLDIAGPVPVIASSYQALTFRNVAHTGHGPLDLQVNAHAYPVAPLHVVWDTE